MSKETADVVNVVEKHRLEEDGTGRGPFHETWKEVEIQSKEDKISENMADYIWNEFGIDVEQKGYDVVKNDD
jgi:hypothetical protein